MFRSILLLAGALSSSAQTQSYYKTISVSNGLDWGSWSYLQMCPSGTHAAGFSIRVEPRQGKRDDTALNGIKLYCVRGDSQDADATVTSHDGFWGDWSTVQWCRGRLVSFQLNVELKQGRGDDTAANDINFKCSNGYVIQGSSGLSWGHWGHWSEECPSGGICGIQTRVEERQGKRDDTALNNVKFVCCS